ncbi:hypothetical protein MAPG_05912 [Magnaporthiopsis poae ATCC 64411]|uniref:Uncharacterized protein n=1 Tax=Magnaporthiopsis poae (strain ATCC 64411 / 73-15) TaxID=644358 RepID=A0A0C4E0N1_MAGP6|nr:hypothetical protein MAPG_05912 [Magnaporthiopsis poae ATCC 64411]
MRTPPTAIMPRLSSDQRGSRPCLPVWTLCLLFVLGAASQGFQSQPWDLVVVTATTTVDIFITVAVSDNAATSPSPSSSTEVIGDLGVVATTTVTLWVESVGSNTWDDSTSTALDTEPLLGTTDNWHPEVVISTVVVEFSTSTTITIDPWPGAADGQSPSLSTAATTQTHGSSGDATDWSPTLDTPTAAASTSPSTTAFAAPGGAGGSPSDSPSTLDPSQATSEHSSSGQPTEPSFFPNSTSSLSVQGSIGATPATVSQGTTATTDSAQEQTASLLPDDPPTPPSAGSILASVHNLTSAVATADLQGTAPSSTNMTRSGDAAAPVISAATTSDGLEVTQSSSDVLSSPSVASSGSLTSESQQPRSTEPTSNFPPMPAATESSVSEPTGGSQPTTTEGQSSTSNGVTPSTSAASTEATSTTEGGLQLPTFTVWPPEATIMPLDREVEVVEPSDDVADAAVVPCKLWFFFVCIIFDRAKIQGWLFVLPPGIYPPGPPPFPVFKFPPELHFQGTLPPWPQFTVGPDHVPTFPWEPDPTECLTQTASLCSATTSFVVSTADEQVRTISTYAPGPTCVELLGCQVADKTVEATATRTVGECMTSTVTDVTFTCSGTAASDCFAHTASPKSGCSVTATTTSIQCTTATAEAGHVRHRRQAPGPANGANIPVCPNVRDWIVWPEDGENRSQTQAIYKALLDQVGNRPAAIETAGSKKLGISYWRVNMTQGQAEGARSIPNVAVVFTTCKDECPDPSTQDGHFRYRFQGKYAGRPHVMEGEAYSRRQMDFLSEEDISGSANFAYGVFVFDNSSGVDVPVYIVDTGANLDHPVRRPDLLYICL